MRIALCLPMLLFLFGSDIINAQISVQSRPTIARTGENLMVDSTITAKGTWSLLRGATFDAGSSRTQDGSGAIKLVKTQPKHSIAVSELIAVEPNQAYTYGFHFKTANGPTYVGGQISLHDANRTFIRNHVSGLGGTSKDNDWQEYALPFVVPQGVAYVGCQVFKGPNTELGGEVWADDFYLGKGFGLSDPPAPKRAFNGGHVRIDELGNFEIQQNGAWTPVFPLCMYSDNHRDWSVYSKQGWNTIIWTGAAHQVRQAKDAVSKFNPNGMLAGFQISQYTFPGHNYGNLGGLTNRLSEIFDEELGDNLLLYYWDNENNHGQWQMSVDVARTIKQFEVDRFGKRQRPLYALQGTFNNARVHASRGLVDVSGTYFGGRVEAGLVKNRAVTGVPESTRGHEGLLILDRQSGQSTPASFAQFNRVDSDGEMRLRLYNSIIYGAKAMGYWRDCYKACDDKFMTTVGPVDKKPWWPDFPNLRREVDTLLPLIRQPHWTAWTVNSDSSSDVKIGTRELDGKAHLIFVNQTSLTQRISIRLNGLAYDPSEAWDVLRNQKIAKIDDGSFTLSLVPIGIGSGTQVVRLE